MSTSPSWFDQEKFSRLVKKKPAPKPGSVGGIARPAASAPAAPVGRATAPVPPRRGSGSLPDHSQPRLHGPAFRAAALGSAAASRRSSADRAAVRFAPKPFRQHDAAMPSTRPPTGPAARRRLLRFHRPAPTSPLPPPPKRTGPHCRRLDRRFNRASAPAAHARRLRPPAAAPRANRPPAASPRRRYAHGFSLRAADEPIAKRSTRHSPSPADGSRSPGRDLSRTRRRCRARVHAAGIDAPPTFVPPPSYTPDLVPSRPAVPLPDYKPLFGYDAPEDEDEPAAPLPPANRRSPRSFRPISIRRKAGGKHGRDRGCRGR